MGSSVTFFDIYKSLYYNVYARADGKWDYLEPQSFNSSQTVNVIMTTYDGLDMTAGEQLLSALPLDFSDTVLPWKWDYEDSLAINKYCLMPVGTLYKKLYEEVGTLEMVGDLLNEDGVVSGFAAVAAGGLSNSYLKVKDTFPSHSTWEAVIKIKLSIGDYKTIFSINNSQFTLGLYANGYGNRLMVWGSAADSHQGSSTLTNDTVYWIKVTYDGTDYKIYLSTTGAFAGEEVLDYTSSANAPIAQGSICALGVNLSTNIDMPFTHGKIYADDCYMNIDGNRWWTGSLDVFYSAEGCLYNYTDDSSPVTLNAFVIDHDKSIVLTPDNSYTNGYLLGTVDIPAHDVYSYSESTSTWTQPVLTGGGGSPSSFGVYSGIDDAWKAFNGDTASGFSTTDKYPPYYIAFHNPTPIVVTNMTIFNGSKPPVDWYFQYTDYDDGTASVQWTTIASGTNTNTTPNTSWSFNVPYSGAHKYYRLIITSTTEINLGINEIEISAYIENSVTWTKTLSPWTQPVLSSNGTMGGSSFACDMSSINSSRYAWHAFDGSTAQVADNQAQTSNSMPAWISFYNPEPIIVTQMTVYNGDTPPVDWEFQCSDDNSTWTTLTSGTNTVTTNWENWSFDVPNSGAHKYYRFYVTSSTYQYYLGINEFKITAHE